MQRFQYRHPRFKVNAPLTFYLTPGSPLRGRCIDISADGMKAELDQDVPVGSVLRLELSLGGDSLALAARVAYYDQNYYGLVFEFSSDEERSLLGERLQALHKVT